MSCRCQGNQTNALVAAENMNTGTARVKNGSLVTQVTAVKDLLNCPLPLKKQLHNSIIIDNLNLSSVFGFLGQKRNTPEFDLLWKTLLHPQTPAELISEAAKQADSVNMNKRFISILLTRTLQKQADARHELENLAQDESISLDLRQRAKLALFALAYDQDKTMVIPDEMFPARRKSEKSNSQPTWLLDVDGTLYSKHNPVLRAIINKIAHYASEKLQLSPEEGLRFTDEQYDKYGSTLAGFVVDHPDLTNPLEFMEQAHDVPMAVKQSEKDDVIKVRQLKGRKYILTNASSAHARRVWQQVANQALSYKVACDGVDMLPYSKPHPYAYLVALHNINTHPSECVMVDDSAANTAAALRLGMKAVLVGTNDTDQKVASLGVTSVGDLPLVLPALT